MIHSNKYDRLFINSDEGNWDNGQSKKIVISKNLNDKISTRFAIWISFALYASTFVVLILAAYLFDVNCYKVMFSDFNNFLCVVHVSLGIVIGLLFHEFAHALCALACNLEVMEIAVRFDKLRPIAYAKIIGLSTLHSKVEKIFIYFAGVTSHYFILGVALLLSKWNAYMFFIALVNFIFALVNSSIYMNSDGAKIIKIIVNTNENAAHEKKFDFSFFAVALTSNILLPALIIAYALFNRR